jgi:predicted nucleotidyltransferase
VQGKSKFETPHAAFLDCELRRFVVQLRELGASKVVLFGSYAEGRRDVQTDLDLFVVIESALPFVERTAWLYRELAPRVACDILAYTPEEWVTMQERPFVRDALLKGEILYEAKRD